MSKDERQWHQQHLQDCKAQLDQGREVLAAAGVLLFDSDSITHGIEQLIKQRGALDWEAAELRAALLFVWSRMKLSADGGTATFTHDELKRIGASKISDEADAKARAE